jgi:hypothetical protein
MVMNDDHDVSRVQVAVQSTSAPPAAQQQTGMHTHLHTHLTAGSDATNTVAYPVMLLCDQPAQHLHSNRQSRIPIYTRV